MSQRRRRRAIEEEPMLFDLPLSAPGPADRRARREVAAAPIQVDLFTAVAEEEIEDDVERGEDEQEPAALETLVEDAPEAPAGPVIAGAATRFLAGCADAVLHLGVLGGAYLGVLALDVEPSLADWPAFATLVVAFSFLTSVVSLAFWGQTAGMAWRGLQTRDRLQRPLDLPPGGAALDRRTVDLRHRRAAAPVHAGRRLARRLAESLGDLLDGRRAPAPALTPDRKGHPEVGGRRW